jgi:hypothetical protein
MRVAVELNIYTVTHTKTNHIGHINTLLKARLFLAF